MELFRKYVKDTHQVRRRIFIFFIFFDVAHHPGLQVTCSCFVLQ